MKTTSTRAPVASYCVDTALATTANTFSTLINVYGETINDHIINCTGKLLIETLMLHVGLYAYGEYRPRVYKNLEM